MYPIWLKIYLPKNIIFMIMPFLFIIALILTIYSLKNKLSIKEILKKYLLKIFLITFTLNLLSSILLFISGIIFNVNVINKINIINIIIIILIGFLMFILNKKIVNIKLSVFLTLFLMPYLLLFPLNIDSYKNTNLSNNKNISGILNILEIDKKSFSIKGNSLTIELNSYISYKNLENYASILFNLINADKIFFIKDKVYSFYIEDINKIFDVKNISINEINNRYKFTNDGIYMGHIDNYDIFDESTSCEEKTEYLKDNYYINCSSINDLYLYNKEEKINLKDIINNLNIEQLLKTNLNIIKK